MFPSKNTTEVRVYLLRTNRWRVSIVKKYGFFHINVVHMNGKMHWLVTCKLKEDALANFLIISFDFTEENIIVMDVPNYNSEDDVLLYESPLSVANSLIFSICGYEKRSEIYFMKDY